MRPLRFASTGIRGVVMSVVLVCVFCSAAFGELELVTGDLVLELSAGRCWTLFSMHKGGRPICNNPGSAQGTVLNVDGELCGSAHLNEELLGARLFVDGVEETVGDGLSYSGDVIKFVRTSQIADAYELTSIMTIKADYTNEYIIFEGLDASKRCIAFYGFLGSRANRLIKCASYDRSGTLLWSHMTNEDDGSNTYFGAVTAVAQYDPNLCDGVCSIVKIGVDLELNTFIKDRTTDNKLYCRFRGVEGPADPNKYFAINQQLVFFEADGGNWTNVVSELVSINTPCADADIGGIYGDVRDCRVDCFDLAALVRDWSGSGTGDLDGSGLVDYSDLKMLTSQWLDCNLNHAEVCYW